VIALFSIRDHALCKLGRQSATGHGVGTKP